MAPPLAQLLKALSGRLQQLGAQIDETWVAAPPSWPALAALPAPLVCLLSEADGARFSWKASASLPFGDLIRWGSLNLYSVAEIADAREFSQEMATQATDASPDVMRAWERWWPFAGFASGDELCLTPEGEVRFKEHSSLEMPEIHGLLLGRDLPDFWKTWSALGFVEIWDWSEVLKPGLPLSVSHPTLQQWAQQLGVSQLGGANEADNGEAHR